MFKSQFIFLKVVHVLYSLFYFLSSRFFLVFCLLESYLYVQRYQPFVQDISCKYFLLACHLPSTLFMVFLHCSVFPPLFLCNQMNRSFSILHLGFESQLESLVPHSGCRKIHQFSSSICMVFWFVHLDPDLYGLYSCVC